MSAHSRRKGRRGENELVAILEENGYPAERVSEGGSPGLDVEALRGRLIEVKRRAVLPTRTLDLWLSDANLVALRSDRGTWRVYLELDELLDLLEEARHGKLPRVDTL